MIAASEQFSEPTSFQGMMIADARGHAERLAETFPNDRALQIEASGNLVLFGIRTNNFDLMYRSLGAMDAFSQYDALYDILEASSDPQEQLRMTQESWDLLISQADRTSHAEGGETDYEPADVRYTVLSQQLLDFAVLMYQHSSREDKQVVAISTRDQLVESITAISKDDYGRIDRRYDRLKLVTYLVDRFNRICGEAGLWNVMTSTNSAEFFIYKAAAGDLTDEDQATLELQAQSQSDVESVNARAALAVGGDEAEKTSFRRKASTMMYGIKGTQTLPAQQALRWAAPDLWAYAVVLPYPSVTNTARLDEVIGLNNPRFGRAVRDYYADICYEALTSGERVHVLYSFVMALHMLRGQSVEPGSDDTKSLIAYLQHGHQVVDQLLAESATGDEGLEASSTPPDARAVNAAAERWSLANLPHVDELAELEIQAAVLSLAMLSDSVSFDTLRQLRDHVNIQATQMSARQSLVPVLEAIDDRVGTVLASADQRLATVKETQVVAEAAAQPKPFQIAINPTLQEPYL